MSVKEKYETIVGLEVHIQLATKSYAVIILTTIHYPFAPR